MRVFFSVFSVLAVAAACAQAQTPQTLPPAGSSASGQASPAPDQQPAATAPVVTLSILPMAPPDLDSPYASPRDAARHWFQTTLANLREQHDIRGAVRGFAQALLLDRTYAAAAFNLGVLAAIDGKWEDAATALEEASRLDHAGLGAEAKPHLERARLLALLERSAEGRRKRRYDEALYGLLPVLPNMAPSDAAASLVLVGRIDPARWEAPALLAGLEGNGTGYDVSAQFLTIAVKNSSDAALKARLQAALDAALREVRYASGRFSAETAAESGKYAEAAEFYEAAWSTVPARSVNAMQAASAWLLTDNAARACTVLLRLRESGEGEFAGLASAMLKELEPVEAAAKGSAGDVREFYRDRGSSQPPRIADLIPPVDRAQFEIYGRSLPRLADDPEPVVLLAALAADRDPASPAPVPPALGAPAIAGDRPWSELKSLWDRPATDAAKAARPLQAANLIGNPRVRRIITVTSEPAGAKVFSADHPEPLCETPCSVQASEGKYTLRFSLPGFQDEQEEIATAGADRELKASLVPTRGSVIVETPAPAKLTINGTPDAAESPAELSLLPGLHRISADFGSGLRERVVNVKPGARLRIVWR